MRNQKKSPANGDNKVPHLIRNAGGYKPDEVAAMIATMQEGFDLGGGPFTEDDRYGAAAIGVRATPIAPRTSPADAGVQ